MPGLYPKGIWSLTLFLLAHVGEILDRISHSFWLKYMGFFFLLFILFIFFNSA